MLMLTTTRMYVRMYVELMALKEGVRERAYETLSQALRRLYGEEKGAVMVEYALLIAGIGVALITAIGLLYLAISGVFTRVTEKLDTAATTP